MVTMQLDGFEDEVRRVVRDELTRALEGFASPAYLNVKSAASFLDTTQAAVRAMVKRGELPVHRTPNGRVLFSPTALTAWAEGGDGT